MSIIFDEKDDSSKGSYAVCEEMKACHVLGAVCEEILNLRSENFAFSSVSYRKRTLDHSDLGEDRCTEPVSFVNDMPAKRPRHVLPLPKNPSRYYAEQVVKALNTSDSSYLYQNLKKISTKDLKIVKHVYPLYTPDYDTEDATEDATVTLEFPSIEAFCHYITTWYTFVPDGVFESSEHRVVVNGLPTFVFISCLRFQGVRIASKTVDLLNTPFQNFPPHVHEDVLTSEVIRHGGTYAQLCRLQGSLVTYVNKHGLLEKLEFYLCQH